MGKPCMSCVRHFVLFSLKLSTQLYNTTELGRKFGEMTTDGYLGIQILPNSISAEDHLVGWGGERCTLSIHHLSRPPCLTALQNFLPTLNLVDLQFVTAFKIDNIAMTL